jgi:phosphate starvation-inducible PhoH-like protein
MNHKEPRQNPSKLVFDDLTAFAQVLGQQSAHLKLLERELGVQAGVRGNEVSLQGADHDLVVASRLLEQLYALARRGSTLYADDVERAIRILKGDKDVDLASIFTDTVCVAPRSRLVTPKGLAQKRYVDAIRRHDIVFGIGPAGTGKTYLAMAMAIAALNAKEIKRIILTRPAVEAGEKLGFLPGSLMEKVNPYLRPLYDALNDMMDLERAAQMIDRGHIEVAPLAFMRGRTLNDSFVILDEAQNTTGEQMKMFLTRLGYNSKAVITGDVTQVDLPTGQRSGLTEAARILAGVEGLSFITFTEVDVVRHPLVQAIIKAYEVHDEQKRQAKAQREQREPEAKPA